MVNAYVHGYHPRENTRLQDQASTLEELLHSDTHFPPGCRILEAGCGVGAQTVPLARNNPHALITAVDISETSAGEARRRVAAAGLTNVQVLQGDIFHLPFQPGSFDHLFLCFVLEHLSRPVEALRILKDFIKPGGTITAIEGDHGSAYFYPSEESRRQCHDWQGSLSAALRGRLQ
jgi:ubiquinone/menaquinone biosynthesis C-methylase UbiE